MKKIERIFMVRILAMLGFCCTILVMSIYGTVTYGSYQTLIGGLFMLCVCGVAIHQFWVFAVKKQYITLVGTLESKKPYGYRKQKTELLIRLENNKLIQLVTDRNAKMKVGKRYVFYFHQMPPEVMITSDMLTQRFIDFEELVVDDAA